jgi:hypothetical protein
MATGLPRAPGTQRGSYTNFDGGKWAIILLQGGKKPGFAFACTGGDLSWQPGPVSSSRTIQQIQV